MNRLKNRLFVDELDIVELVPLSGTKLGPTPSAQVCTKFEYIDLSFRMFSYWTVPEFLPLSKDRSIFHTQYSFPKRRLSAMDHDLAVHPVQNLMLPDLLNGTLLIASWKNLWISPLPRMNQ